LEECKRKVEGMGAMATPQRLSSIHKCTILLAVVIALSLANVCLGQTRAEDGDLETDVVCTILLRGRPGSTDQAPSVAEAKIDCTGPGTPITIDANPVLVDLLGETVPGANLVAGSPVESYLSFKSQPSLTIRDSEIDDLVLAGFAPISIFNTTVQFLESEFDRNSATEAGVVNSAGSTLRFRNCTFRANTGVKFGVLAVTGGESLTIVNSLFLGNKGGADGAIGLKSGAVKVSHVANVTIDATEFRGNRGFGTGASAFLAFRGVNATLTGVDFHMNLASNGSAVVMKGGRLGVLGCVFATNGGGAGGSALQIEDNAAVSLLGCEFDENRGDTGALTLRNSSADVRASAFTHNRGDSLGGAASVLDGLAGSPVAFTDCVFENNSSPLGGAMAASATPEVLVDRCVFENNTATGIGGGLYQWNCNTTRVVGSTFRGNEARLAGGAVAQTSCASMSPDVESQKRLKLDCKAREGLACEEVELSGNQFVLNVANLRGGSVFQRGCAELDLVSNRYEYGDAEGGVMYQKKCVALREDNETYEAVGLGDGGELNTVVVRKKCPM